MERRIPSVKNVYIKRKKTLKGKVPFSKSKSENLDLGGKLENGKRGIK